MNGRNHWLNCSNEIICLQRLRHFHNHCKRLPGQLPALLWRVHPHPFPDKERHQPVRVTPKRVSNSGRIRTFKITRLHTSLYRFHKERVGCHSERPTFLIFNVFHRRAGQKQQIIPVRVFQTKIHIQSAEFNKPFPWVLDAGRRQKVVALCRRRLVLEREENLVFVLVIKVNNGSRAVLDALAMLRIFSPS